MRMKVRNGRLLSVLVVSIAFLTGALPALAQSNMAAPTAAPTAATTPAQALQTLAGKFVQDLGNKAVSVVANKGATQQQRDDQYRDLLQSAFDLQTIGHFVLGNAWESATQQQRTDYMTLFRALVVKIYGEKLNLYAGEKFIVSAVRPETDRDTIVGSQIVHADGSSPTLVDWRVRDRDGTLQIIDVTVAGVSQSITQRSEYSAILQRNNGNIQALLDSMRQQLNGSKSP